MTRPTCLEVLHEYVLDSSSTPAEQPLQILDPTVPLDHWARSVRVNFEAADEVMRRDGARPELLGRSAVILYSGDVGPKAGNSGLYLSASSHGAFYGSDWWVDQRNRAYYPLIALRVDSSPKKLQEVALHEFTHPTQKRGRPPRYHNPAHITNIQLGIGTLAMLTGQQAYELLGDCVTNPNSSLATFAAGALAGMAFAACYGGLGGRAEIRERLYRNSRAEIRAAKGVKRHADLQIIEYPSGVSMS